MNKLKKIIIRTYSFWGRGYRCGVNRIFCLKNKLKQIPWEEIRIFGNVQGTTYKGRLPKELFQKMCRKKAFKVNARCLSGCYLDFLTNARECVVKLVIADYVEMKHMTSYAITGADLYTETGCHKLIWKGCFTPNRRGEIHIKICEKGLARVRIYFPLFVPIEDVKIFVSRGAMFSNYQENIPTILFYGSSITQGCAASRPGLSYSALVGRYLDYHIYNLGFSESAHGEKEIAQWIGKIQCQYIVLEYDHNSSVEELKERHYIFYKSIRENNSEAFIIFLSRGSAQITLTYEEYKERRFIIQKTVELAHYGGDMRIAYIDGMKLYEENHRADYFTDGKHPNDAGMHMIAKKIVELVDEYELRNQKENKKNNTKTNQIIFESKSGQI